MNATVIAVPQLKPRCNEVRTRARWHVVILLFCSFLCGELFKCAGYCDDNVDPGKQRVKTVIANWDTRRRAYPTIEFYFEGEVQVSRGSVSEIYGDLLPKTIHGDFPPKDYAFARTRRILIDFANDRIRKEVTGETCDLDIAEFYFIAETFLYDGKSIQRYVPRELNTTSRRAPGKFEPELFPLKDNQFEFFFDFPEELLLMTCGTPPKRISDGDENDRNVSRLKVPIREERFTFLREEEYRGNKCIVLMYRSPHENVSSLIEYYVDTDRDNTVVKAKWIHAGKSSALAEIEFDATEDGWMPFSMIVYRYSGSGELESVERLRRKRYDTAPRLENSMFHVEPKEGMVIFDDNSNRAFIYKGAMIPPVDVRVAYQAEESMRESVGKNKSFYSRIPAFYALIMAVVIAGVMMRRFSTKSR